MQLLYPLQSPQISLFHTNHLSILSSSSALLIQDKPAILHPIKAKERRSLRDPGLTKTLHTPRHVTWSTILTLLSCFIQQLSASSHQHQLSLLLRLYQTEPELIQPKPDDTLRESKGSWEIFILTTCWKRHSKQEDFSLAL